MRTIEFVFEYAQKRRFSPPDLKKAVALLLSLWLLFSSGMRLDSCEASEIEAQIPPVHMKMGAIIDSFAGVSLEDTKIAIKLIFETRFKKKYPRHQGDVFLFSDMHSVLDAINKKKINCVCISTLDYLITKEENNLIPVRTAKLGESAKSRFVFLVRKDQIESIDKLMKKTLIIERGTHGDVATMWLNTLLFEHSLLESSRYFKSVERMEKGSLGVMKLFFGKVDSCLVQASTYHIVKELNPQIGTNLHVLFESPDFLMGVLAVSKDIDEHTRKFILLYSDELAEDREGEKILSIFRVKGVSEFGPEAMESIENLYHKYLELKPAGR